MFKRILLIVIILTSLKFYQLIFIPEVVVKASEWIGIGLIAAFTVLYMVYHEEKLLKMNFTFPILLILFSVVISMFGANLFQGQSFIATAYGQRVIYFYFIYFMLHYMRMSGAFIVRTILVLGVVYIVLYLSQYFLYPRQISTAKMFLDRGTLRIFLSGAGFLVISYFIWLYYSFQRLRMRYLVFLLLSLGVFVLLGTRQVLASVFFLTLLFILQSRVVKSKFLIFLLIGMMAIPVFFIFQDVILSMFEVTQRQSRDIEGNIRIRAARYFLTDFMKNDWSYLIGNGATGRSRYALRMVRLAEEHGYYQSDIGLIGEYTKYGLLYVAGVILILVRALRARLPEHLMFIKYNFLGITLTLVTAAGAFGSSGTNILINCMLLYLIDLYRQEPDSFGSLIPEKKPAE